jgi:hypothetical protein
VVELCLCEREGQRGSETEKRGAPRMTHDSNDQYYNLSTTDQFVLQVLN